MTIACSCKDKGKRKTYKVRLAGGLEISKSSEDEALKFAAKHPGSRVIKPVA